MFFSRPYRVIGVMSGTSLDGLDIALCRFSRVAGRWRYAIEEATTFTYNDEWRQRLGSAQNLDAHEFSMLNIEYGLYIGERINEFRSQCKNEPTLVASHGHTVFHQPPNRLTWQVGDATAIASVCRLPVIADFRKADVLQGGQGAPLVPIGDELLFGNYDICLNLGGFANMSFRSKAMRVAYDICPVNILLNHLALKTGKPFDDNGRIAATGAVLHNVIQSLDRLSYYSRPWPKSLSREWFEKEVLPIFNASTASIADQLMTATTHIARRLAAAINEQQHISNVLITGGGVFNTLLMDNIKKLTNKKIVIPSQQLIEFKEAMIFAFLGLLRYTGQTNILCSVTGAKKNSSAGIIALP